MKPLDPPVQIGYVDDPCIIVSEDARRLAMIRSRCKISYGEVAYILGIGPLSVHALEQRIACNSFCGTFTMSQEDWDRAIEDLITPL